MKTLVTYDGLGNTKLAKNMGTNKIHYNTRINVAFASIHLGT